MVGVLKTNRLTQTRKPRNTHMFSPAHTYTHTHTHSHTHTHTHKNMHICVIKPIETPPPLGRLQNVTEKVPRPRRSSSIVSPAPSSASLGSVDFSSGSISGGGSGGSGFAFATTADATSSAGASENGDRTMGQNQVKWRHQ